VFEKRTFSTSSIYYDVLNSDNPQESYDALSNEDKALVWQTKYEIFSENSNLNQDQLDAINNLSEFVYDAQLNQDYNLEESYEIENQLIVAGFTNTDLKNLIISVDNPFEPSPGNQTDCLICTTIIDEGPCHPEEYNGHWHLVKDVKIQKKFLIFKSEPKDAKSPCDDEEIEDWFNNGGE